MQQEFSPWHRPVDFRQLVVSSIDTQIRGEPRADFVKKISQRIFFSWLRPKYIASLKKYVSHLM